MTRSTGARVKFVREQFEAFGIRITSSSRFGRMFHVMAEDDGTLKEIKPYGNDASIAQESVRDMAHMEIVFDELGQVLKSDPGAMERLRIAARDPVVAGQHDSSGRDAQAELLVAAFCASTNLDPVFGSPDILCRGFDPETVIEVKRITSDERFEQRIRAGANQIKESRTPGIIAIDVTIALNAENRRIMNVDHPVFPEVHKRHIHKLIDKYYSRLQEWVRGKGVLGLILQDHQITRTSDGVWGMDSLTTSVRTTRENQGRRRLFDQFRDKFYMGIPKA